MYRFMIKDKMYTGIIYDGSNYSKISEFIGNARIHSTLWDIKTSEIKSVVIYVGKDAERYFNDAKNFHLLRKGDIVSKCDDGSVKVFEKAYLDKRAVMFIEQ